MSIKCSDIGPPDAKVCIVTDAPSAKDEQTGTLFCDSTGRLLKQMLHHCGLDFNSCYVTSVMHVRPPCGSFSYMYSGKMPTPQLEALWNALKVRIETRRPEVVIVLGNEAMKALCNKSNVNDYRGTWLSYKGIKVMPTFHPSYIMKVYNDHVIFEMDISKAIKRKPCTVPPILLRPSLQQVLNWVHNAKKYNGRVAFDIETVKDTIRCIGFATDKPQKSAIVIPFMVFNSGQDINSISKVIKPFSSSGSNANSYWTEEDEISVLDALQDFFSSDVKFVGQNSIAFDEPFIKREFGITINNHYMDTMNAWHNLYSELPKSLNFLCSVFTDYQNYWAEKTTTEDTSEWTYNAMDCIITLEASIQIEDEMLKSELYYDPV
jgi:uracil-DNA glycosylase